MWLDVLNQMKKVSGKTTDLISQESGVPRGTLNKLFAGQTKDPQYSTLKAVVNCLGFTVDDLDEDEKNAPTPDDAEANVEEVEVQLRALFESRGYVNPGEELSESDLNFSIALVDMLDAHFNKR